MMGTLNRDVDVPSSRPGTMMHVPKGTRVGLIWWITIDTRPPTKGAVVETDFGAELCVPGGTVDWDLPSLL
jgi:hypothetical protein